MTLNIFGRWTIMKDMCVAVIADCSFNIPVPNSLSGRTGRVRSWKPGRSGWRRGYAGEKKCSTPSSSRPSTVFVFSFAGISLFTTLLHPTNGSFQPVICVFSTGQSLSFLWKRVSTEGGNISTYYTFTYWIDIIWAGCLCVLCYSSSRWCAAGWTRWKRRGSRCAEGHFKTPTKMDKAWQS